jgi:hypothetical protein
MGHSTRPRKEKLMDFYQVSRSSLKGKEYLPSFYASHLAAIEAALASASLDVIQVMTTGGDGILMIQREGDFVRVMLAGSKSIVTYHVTTVETDSTEGEEIVFTMNLR